MKKKTSDKTQRRNRVKQILTLLVFLSMLLSAVFIVVRLILAPNTLSGNEIGGHVSTKSDYVLMLLQCMLGMVAMLLPGWLSKRWQVEIPSVMLIFFTIFLYCAIYLGEVRYFYYLVPHWDTILHTFSGFVLGCLSFSVITLMNRSERVPVSLTPAFVAVFAFCFSLMLGVMWELYEYAADGLIGTNMQKFMRSDGTLLSGHEALGDTMKDLFVDAIGALVTSAVGYVSLKYDKGWIENFQLRLGKKSKDDESGTP